MTRQVAAILTNYNMPERTDALCAHLLSYVRWPLTLFVVDNGSDLTAPSKFTTLRLPANRQTTGGWLAGLDQARRAGEWLAYWFLITSAEFVGRDDPLIPLAKLLMDDGGAVGVHPALTEDSTSDWPHLFDRGSGRPRKTWHIDNIASLYRADWFDSMGGFRPEITMAWGIDLEMSWKARQQGRGLFVHEGSRVKKITDIGYRMGRMNMDADERRVLAGSEMAHVLGAEYGPFWWDRMTGERVTTAMLMPVEFSDLERVSWAWVADDERLSVA